MEEFESSTRYTLKFTVALDISTGNFCQNFLSKNCKLAEYTKRCKENWFLLCELCYWIPIRKCVYYMHIYTGLDMDMHTFTAVHTDICTYTAIHVFIYTLNCRHRHGRMHIQVYTVHTHLHYIVYTCMYVRLYVYTNVCVYMARAHSIVHMHMCMHAYTQLHICASVHTHVYTTVLTYMCSYTH